MRFVGTEDVRQWLRDAEHLSELSTSIGQKHTSPEYLEEVIGLPLHLRFVIDCLIDESEDEEVDQHALDSIPFYSLCKGLFLPLSGLSPERVAYLFGLEVGPAPDYKAREKLLSTFLEKDTGLSLPLKLSAVLGDAFRGKPSTFRRDSLLRLLQSVNMTPRRQLLDRLTVVGDVAVLFAESVARLKPEEPLTAAEVLETLRFVREQPRIAKFDLVRSLFRRMGKLEAYFLAKLLLRRAGFGFDYQGPLIARALAEQFQADAGQVAHAMALTDVFIVSNLLETKGAAGLREIQLQPLVPIRPALAGGLTDDISKFPVWVERKYDGIRFMLHKSTDARGSVLAGAYTRRRGDWLESVPGLELAIKALPCQNAIVDGEIFGTSFSMDGGVRPASVYDVYSTIRGDKVGGVNLRFAAFDLLYLNGQDLTGLSLAERRQRLQMLIAPVASLQLPVPVTLAEGQLANDMSDVNRYYQHFRAQGYEGVITKDLQGTYKLATRDKAWAKRKPEITLDLVLLAGVFAVTSKERAGMFGSYVIGARVGDGAFEDVGDVAGIDRVRDAEIQQEIMREGLLTGARIERPSASGVRPGVEFRPYIVVTVKFEGITREQTEGGRLRLRDPKLVMIRSDKSPYDADKVEALEEIFLRQRVG